MLRPLLIHLNRRPAGAIRKVSFISSNPPPTQRFQLYLAAAAPLAIIGYAAFAWTGSGKLEFNDTDLVSNEALWALYERWCRHHKIHRTAEDMRHRFQTFKWNANHVHGINHLDLGYKITLNHFSDETYEEARNGCSFPFPNWAEDIKKLEEKASPTKEACRGDACAICRQEFSATHPCVAIGCKHEFHPLCIFKCEELEEEEGKVLWGLYETWCRNQGLYKSSEDMKRDFNKLKLTLQSFVSQHDNRLSTKTDDKVKN